MLGRQFLERSRLLQARSALATVRAVLRRGGCADADRIDARVEEVMAAAHEFVEVRLLTDLRTGTVAVAERLEEEMDRLLGGSGHSIARGWESPTTPRCPVARRRVRGAGPLAAGRVVAADEPGGEDRGPRCGTNLRGDRGGAGPGPRLTPIEGQYEGVPAGAAGPVGRAGAAGPLGRPLSAANPSARPSLSLSSSRGSSPRAISVPSDRPSRSESASSGSVPYFCS